MDCFIQFSKTFFCARPPNKFFSPRPPCWLLYQDLQLYSSLYPDWWSRLATLKYEILPRQDSNFGTKMGANNRTFQMRNPCRTYLLWSANRISSQGGGVKSISLIRLLLNSARQSKNTYSYSKVGTYWKNSLQCLFQHVGSLLLHLVFFSKDVFLLPRSTQ